MPDVTALALSFLLSAARPAVTDAMRQGLNAPREFLPQSTALPDVAAAALQCYHPTGRFRGAEVLQRPWQEAQRWQAPHSAVVRIHWSGFSGQPYVSDVAFMERNRMVRGVYLGTNAIMPPSSRCPLKEWQPVNEGR